MELDELILYLDPGWPCNPLISMLCIDFDFSGFRQLLEVLHEAVQVVDLTVSNSSKVSSTAVAKLSPSHRDTGVVIRGCVLGFGYVKGGFRCSGT